MFVPRDRKFQLHLVVDSLVLCRLFCLSLDALLPDNDKQNNSQEKEKTISWSVSHVCTRRGVTYVKPMIRGMTVVWKVVVYFSQMSSVSLGLTHFLFHNMVFVCM